MHGINIQKCRFHIVEYDITAGNVKILTEHMRTNQMLDTKIIISGLKVNTTVQKTTKLTSAPDKINNASIGKLKS